MRCCVFLSSYSIMFTLTASIIILCSSIACCANISPMIQHNLSISPYTLKMIVLFSGLLLAACNLFGNAQDRIKRVENGQSVDQDTQPWLAILNLDSFPICGSFLINRGLEMHGDRENLFADIVLTAAHCVVDKSGQIYYSHSKLTVSFVKASWNVQEPNQIDHSIIQVIVHPKFQRSPLLYDIALLKLMKPVQISRYIMPIPLAWDFTVNDNCSVSGWGHQQDFNYDPTANITLKSVAVNNLTDYGVEITGKIPSDTRIITGDSGGPLICRHHNQTIALGIVSNTDPDYIVNHFTSIPQLLPWIIESIYWIDYLRMFHPHLQAYTNAKASTDMEELEHLSLGVFGHVPKGFDEQLTFSYLDEIDFKQIWFMESLHDKVKLHQNAFYMYDVLGFALVEDVYQCAVICYLENYNGICSYLVSQKKCFLSMSRFVCRNEHCAKLALFKGVTISFGTELYNFNRASIKHTAIGKPNPSRNLSAISIVKTDRPDYHCIGEPYSSTANKTHQYVVLSISCLKALNLQSIQHYLVATLIILASGRVHQKAIMLDLSQIEHETGTILVDVTSMNVEIDANESTLHQLTLKPLLKTYSPQSGAFAIEPFTKPWMVHFQTSSNKQCVGVLIKDIEYVNGTRFVLTSAACAKESDRRYVTIGTHYQYLRSNFEKKLSIDKAWENMSMDGINGIGIIKLQQVVFFDNHALPIQLLSEEGQLDNKELRMLSWDIKCGDKHNALYEVPVLNTHSMDENILVTRRLHFWQETDVKCKERESFGKPLVMFDPSIQQDILVGFHSSTNVGLIEEHTSVWPYIDWIKERMQHADDADEDENYDDY